MKNLDNTEEAEPINKENNDVKNLENTEEAEGLSSEEHSQRVALKSKTMVDPFNFWKHTIGEVRVKVNKRNMNVEHKISDP